MISINTVKHHPKKFSGQKITFSLRDPKGVEVPQNVVIAITIDIEGA